MRKRQDTKNKMRKANMIRRYLHSSMQKEKNDEKAQMAFKTPAYQKHVRLKKDKIVNSIAEVDTSSLKLPLITVYEHPEDYPESYVARIFDIDIPTDTVIVKDSLEEIQLDIMDNTGKMFFRRSEKDAPSVIGVWL